MANKQFKHIRAYRTGWLLAILDWIIAAPILLVWQRKTSKSLTLDYLGDRKQIEKDIKHGAFFMTNHRDIVMDSAWLSLLLRKRYFIRPFIGIGNNGNGKSIFVSGNLKILNSFHEKELIEQYATCDQNQTG